MVANLSGLAELAASQARMTICRPHQNLNDFRRFGRSCTGHFPTLSWA